MWVHVILRRAAGRAQVVGGTHFSTATSKLPTECSFVGFPRQRQPLATPLGGVMFSGPIACFHGSATLTGFKKLPVNDDVIITRQQAKDLIYRLHQKERGILLEELERYNTQNCKRKFPLSFTK
ncbi:hypothetical protein BIW11_06671, partial [Tropilaelaps mercedesae]